MRWTVATLAVLMAMARIASAGPTVTAGTHRLDPGLAGQAIQVMVSGGEAVQGLELNAQVADGASGPTFETSDILTGTIFAANNTGANLGGYVDPQRLYQGTTTASGTVPADGLLATITLSTIGVAVGQYDLLLQNDLEGSTNFADPSVAPTLQDGTILVAFAGDANLDGAVTDADYTIWADNYGNSSATFQQGDFNVDGSVTDADYTLWADNYGAGVGVVPEPLTISVLLAGLGLWTCRKRQG
jgi:hypothetical protein